MNKNRMTKATKNQISSWMIRAQLAINKMGYPEVNDAISKLAVIRTMPDNFEQLVNEFTIQYLG